MHRICRRVAEHAPWSAGHTRGCTPAQRSLAECAWGAATLVGSWAQQCSVGWRCMWTRADETLIFASTTSLGSAQHREDAVWGSLGMPKHQGRGGAAPARVLRVLAREGTRMHLMGLADCHAANFVAVLAFFLGVVQYGKRKYYAIMRWALLWGSKPGTSRTIPCLPNESRA